jgi:hypothetical protein
VKPVIQTTFGDGKGNCFTACVASILELSIDEVPDFCVLYGDKEWWIELEKWLALRGLAPLTFTFDCGEQTTERKRLESFYVNPSVAMILSGRNAAGVAHSVVIHEGETHNPNPTSTGELVSWRDIIVFVALRPHLMRTPLTSAEMASGETGT